MLTKCIICKTERAIYGTKDEKKCQYCKNCKLPNMININSKKCIICNFKEASYANSGEKTRKYCGNCKLPDMVNINSKLCIGCNLKEASYANSGEKTRKYCGDCKLPDMVNIASKLCISCNLKRPSFAKLGEKTRKYCNDCKLPDMININIKICKTELCSTQITKKYEGYCAYCYRYLFPDKPMSRNYKTKEYSVVEFIKNNFTDIDIIYNKQISDGCSGKQPDILIDLGEQIIIVEIDEDQHRYYGSTCENKRIMELSQDVNHRPIIFIRFNPDKYKTNLGNITSCWKINKNGICGISKQKEWNERLNTLKNTIEYWLKNKTEKTIEVILLYYDE